MIFSCLLIICFSRCSHLPPTLFSSHINLNHLDECLSQLLNLYSEIDKKNRDLLNRTSYIEFEALHLLLSKNTKGLHRALQLPNITKAQPVVRKAIEISISLWLGNFIRAHRIARDLPLHLQLAYRANFSQIRPSLLEIYERGHRSPQGAKFPLEKLSHYLLFDSPKEAADFCLDHGLLLDETSSSVIFKTGTTFKLNTPPKLSNVCNRAIEEKLENVRISDLLYGQSI